jgi:hypothetical protein
MYASAATILLHAARVAAHVPADAEAIDRERVDVAQARAIFVASSIAMKLQALAWLLVCACGPKVLDDGEGSGADDDGDFALSRECRAGCADIVACAPAEFAMLFTDVGQCAASCEALYGGCPDEALVYFECVGRASCEEVAQILVDGPMATACGPAYADAEAACGR